MAKITDGINKFSAISPLVGKGFLFPDDDALLIVSKFTVKAAGEAQVKTTLVNVGSDDAAMTHVIEEGVPAEGVVVAGYVSFTAPGVPEPTEPPVPTETQPAPTEPPVPTQPDQKAQVTIIGLDGKSEVKEFAVGETFTVYTTFNASKVTANKKVASIAGVQTFTSSVLNAADAVDAIGIITDNTTVFPIFGNSGLARITDGKTQFNASSPVVGQGFEFASDDAQLIVTKYTVKAAGNAEVKTSLTDVAADDGTLTPVIVDGVPESGVEVGGYSSFTEPGAVVETYILGDADNNGKVQTMDVSIIQRVVGRMPVDCDKAIARRNGDVDGNGKLEIFDATLIQRHVARMKTDYPIGKPVPVQ